MEKKKHLLVALLVLLLLVTDQAIKIAVKTHMHLYESIWFTDWFQIHFIENNGMAFGMSFINKYALTLFRVAAAIAIGWYIRVQINRGARSRYVFLLALLMAGAAGNIVDCMFYGEIFTASSPFYVSYWVPFGHGYSGFLTGKVVDMFYFPLIVSTWPDWIPIWGGQDFVFFSPVFNFADACVSVSVVALFIFCRPELAQQFASGDNEKTASSSSDDALAESSET